ncbi:MAG: hypothetical protein AAF571_02845 [Verrucomicrobiota bacterium]
MIEIAHSKAKTDEIYKFRYRILFQEMGYHVEGTDQAREEIVEDHDHRSIHFYAERDDQIIAALTLTVLDGNRIPRRWIRIFELDRWSAEKNQISVCSRLAVSPKYRGTLLTFRIFSSAYVYCCNNGILANLAHASEGSIKQYMKLGYKRFGKSFISQSGYKHFPVMLLSYDQKNMQKCGSPFLKLCCSVPAKPKNFYSPVFNKVKSFTDKSASKVIS